MSTCTSGPVAVVVQGRRTVLKWHRARRRKGDPAFTRARIAEALALGASVEIDLQPHASGGFAVLHDATLDRETDGTGPVAAAPAAALRRLRRRDEAGTPLDESVALLEDLAAALPAVGADALLQLDLKCTASALTPAHVSGFAAALGALAPHAILSGMDAAAVRRLAAAAPGLTIGHDPCTAAAIDGLRRSGDVAGFVARALADQPRAQLIYLDHRLILALDGAGIDIVARFHAAGRTVDAWTLRPGDTAIARRLLALRVDQITTDDPEGLAAALA